VDLVRGWSCRTIAAAERVLTRRGSSVPAENTTKQPFWFVRGPKRHEQTIERTALFEKFRYATKQRNFSREQRN
jgi:hypothetical protein